MTNEKKIAVIGSGSWATAIVKILSNNASKVNWYFRNQSDIDHMTQYGHNPRYLSSVQFDLNKLHLSSNLSETLTEADIIILAVPSAFIHNTLKDIPADVFNGKTVFAFFLQIKQPSLCWHNSIKPQQRRQLIPILIHKKVLVIFRINRHPFMKRLRIGKSKRCN